ncbi:hypothetical protein M1B72_05100 [Geomonas paludis]|uniref:AlgX/AlgJ SGNH hydrolase-like domain-containing protein n=1 Tax=Geomonas paludis TaxID=2740185 RepID=A0A6V8MX70_9BACT|nr:hypothetical protein [Geomonas paludis]UPU37088.1 hypothetical protein M1B72_05100 [Geomonas paludis]GFO64815.1 hypothetical protein GMPD_27340 [Geomonas paludis]
MRCPLLATALLVVVTLWCCLCYASDSATAADAGQTVIEGVLTQVSKLPKAASNPYPDCYYTAIVDLHQIVAGKSVPQRIILVLPGFFGRKYAPESGYKTGDKIRATVVPFSSMPDTVKQTQQADEIEDVDLNFFFPQQISLINAYTGVVRLPSFAKKNDNNHEVSVSKNRGNNVTNERKEQIQKDLLEINQQLAANGGDWDKWYASYKGFREQYKVQFDAKASRWIGQSFFSAGRLGRDKIYSKEFVASIIDLKNYLAARNVDLIVVRIPAKGEIVEDLFVPLPTKQTSNPYLLKMYKELLEADVEIITDVVPRAKSTRMKFPLMYYYQDFAEIHPAEGMAWVVAEAFSERVERYGEPAHQKKNFLLGKAPDKFKWPEGHPGFDPAENVLFSTVTDTLGKPLSLTQGNESPVLILGSSFIAFPSLTKGGSIPHYFAYLTGIVPDILHRSGGDRMMLRSVAREGKGFLEKRKVCLFPFTPGTAYEALAPLPVFDPHGSPKTLLAAFTGPGLREAVKLDPKAAEGTFSFLSDGTLRIAPVIKGKGTSGTFTVDIPAEVAKFSRFTMELEFSSKDLTTVTAKYAGQTDSTIRSDTQLANNDLFGFFFEGQTPVEIGIEGNRNFVRAVSIKAIRFYGVTSVK